MSHEPDDLELARLVRALRPAPPADLADRVMARLPEPPPARRAALPLRPRRRLRPALWLGASVLAAAAILVFVVRRPGPSASLASSTLPPVSPAPSARWLVVSGDAADERGLVEATLPTTLRPGDAGGQVVLAPGALALADGDALHLLRGRARLEGRARVITVQAEVAGTTDATVATVVVDPLPDAPEPSMSLSLGLTKTASILAALAGGSAFAVTVASGRAELHPPQAAPVVVAAGGRAELPAAVSRAVPAVASAASTPAAPAGAVSAKPDDTAGPDCAPTPPCDGEDCAAHCVNEAPDDPAEAPRTVVDLAGAPSLGPVDARVTLVEFADFECPYSAKAMSAVHELREIFPRDLRLVFLNYPLPGHKHAELAAEAALAAGAQGKFWEMHDLLFAGEDGLDRAAIGGYAKALGLDLERFQKDLDSHRFAARVAHDKQLADGFGLQGTPTFLFNGRLVRGVRDVGFFRAIVDEELASPRGVTLPPGMVRNH